MVAGHVGAHVSPGVGELDRGEDLVGETDEFGIVVAEQAQQQAPHRLSRTCGVRAQGSKRCIARDLQIGAKSRQQILEGRQGQAALGDGVVQRHEHRMAGFTMETEVQFLLPGVERFAAVTVVLGLVGKVVCRAEKGVERDHVGPQGRGHEARSHRKILVVDARKLLAVAVGALHGPRTGGWGQPGQRLAGGAGVAARLGGHARTSAAQNCTDHGRGPLRSGAPSPTARLCRVM